MIRQVTIDKLHEMRLSAMASAFENQCADAATYQDFSFEDRFGALVDREWEKRKNSKLQKLIRNAEFRYPNASVEAIEYHPDRKLDKGQMLEFSTCRYITDDHHIILKGVSGNGKTFIACALGVAACKNFIKVRYIRLPDLLNELALEFAEKNLKPEGVFVTKVFQGSGYSQFVESCKRVFKTVKQRKPEASRDTSPEMYVVGRGLKPAKKNA